MGVAATTRRARVTITVSRLSIDHDCASYSLFSLKCCAQCDGHPERFVKGADAYTSAEIDDIWARSGRDRPKP